MFTDQALIITGNAVLRRFLNSDPRQIRIFSRGEKKQDDMRKHRDSSGLKFRIGDVRGCCSRAQTFDAESPVLIARTARQKAAEPHTPPASPA